jgi:hypothetical protein
MYRTRLFAGLSVCLAVLAVVRADEPAKSHQAKAKAAEAAFEQLKKLFGDWLVVKAEDERFKGKIGTSYRLTAGGSAIAETIFPGDTMEMLSVYCRDGDDLVLTHYCCMGNQPRMRARLDDKEELVFEFTGGGNLDPTRDAHIHGGRIRMVDADHLRSEWDYWQDGKSAGKHVFELVRKK